MVKIKRKIIKNTLIFLDKFIPVFLLLVVLNLSMPQVSFAHGVDIPSPPQLPYDAGKQEYFNAYVSSVPRLPIAVTDEKREPRFTLKIWVSAYNSHPLQTDSTPCTTASGLNVCKRAQEGAEDIIATNFKYLPFGTKVRFPELFGNKIFIIEDRMNARYWNFFDVWMPDYASAKQFGRKWTTIEIF